MNRSSGVNKHGCNTAFPFSYFRPDGDQQAPATDDQVVIDMSGQDKLSQTLPETCHPEETLPEGSAGASQSIPPLPDSPERSSSLVTTDSGDEKSRLLLVDER